jgi:hypothetical protein
LAGLALAGLLLAGLSAAAGVGHLAGLHALLGHGDCGLRGGDGGLG